MRCISVLLKSRFTVVEVICGRSGVGVAARSSVVMSVRPSGSSVVGSCRWCPELVSRRRAGPLRRDLVLPGASARALARHHGSGDEELSAPHTPRLSPVHRSREALCPYGALLAEQLGVFDISRAAPTITGLRESVVIAGRKLGGDHWEWETRRSLLGAA